MSSSLVTFRYPEGEAEFRMSENTPEVGDVLERNGYNWIVEQVTPNKDGTTVVTLRPGPNQLPRQHVRRADAHRPDRRLTRVSPAALLAARAILVADQA